jgi:outer membrane protein TolC
MGGYALVRPEVGAFGGDWQDMGWLGLTLSWDLSLGGGDFRAADQALERMRTLEMQRKDLETQLTLRAQIAWNDMEKTYKLSQIRGEEFDLATRRFRLAEEKRKVGQMTANRFLELEAELTETEQQFEVARLRFFAARTDYLYATGARELGGGL